MAREYRHIALRVHIAPTAKPSNKCTSHQRQNLQTHHGPKYRRDFETKNYKEFVTK